MHDRSNSRGVIALGLKGRSPGFERQSHRRSVAVTLLTESPSCRGGFNTRECV
jgi:hypothetical protein